MDVGQTSDERLAEELAALINAAYAVSEGDLFVGDKGRTTPGQVTELIRQGGVLVARRDGEIVGCAALQPRDDDMVELGFMSAAPGDWGGGVGRALVHAGEAWAGSRGARTMQMKLLVPRDWAHPLKERLRKWYERLGYRVVHVDAFEAELTTPAQFLVFRKPLGGAMSS